MLSRLTWLTTESAAKLPELPLGNCCSTRTRSGELEITLGKNTRLLKQHASQSRRTSHYHAPLRHQAVSRPRPAPRGPQKTWPGNHSHGMCDAGVPVTSDAEIRRSPPVNDAVNFGPDVAPALLRTTHSFSCFTSPPLFLPQAQSPVGFITPA